MVQTNFLHTSLHNKESIMPIKTTVTHNPWSSGCDFKYISFLFAHPTNNYVNSLSFIFVIFNLYHIIMQNLG